MISFIILAAGKGSRMNILEQKCSLEIIDKAMINYTLDAIRKIKDKEIICVTSYKEKELREKIEITNDINFVHQAEILGTCDAIKWGLKEVSGDEVIIIPGDSPIFSLKLLDNIINYHHNNYADITMVGCFSKDLGSYGKIIYSKNKARIIEACERNDNEGIKNSGVYMFNTNVLRSKINHVMINAKGNEFYFTDIFKYCDEYKSVLYLSEEINGTNTMLELLKLEDDLRKKIILEHIENGVRISNIETTSIGINVKIAKGVKISGNVRILGNSDIAFNSIITDSDIRDSKIGNNTVIYKSVVNKSIIGNYTSVGPYANIREETRICDNVRIGNFVEIKKSEINNNTKCAHLTYVGDTKCGNDVNFGCGVVTCNFDGNKKHQTIIQDNAFIGSNVNLIAPINIAKNTFIAAGCTVTNDTNENDFIKRTF